MNKELKRSAYTAINSVLSVANLELVSRNRNFQNYISFRRTMAGALESGLSVGDYIDTGNKIPGATQETIERLIEIGALHPGVQRICEIGPGSGRYLEKTMQVCQPNSYEIYETAVDWKAWLVQQYKVTARQTDGISLLDTPSGTIDLVHSHKMFPGLPIFTACGYFDEMIRVVNKSGVIVFDVLTEECLAEPYLKEWLALSSQWPVSMVPKQFTSDYFAQSGFRLLDSFFIKMPPGITEYLVFSR